MSEDRATSTTLLARARADDPIAWTRMTFLYEPLVRAWFVRWGERGADVDDLTQDVMQAMATGISGFRSDRPGDSFRGWLRGIAKNKRLDHLRRCGRQPAAAGGTEAQLFLGNVADAPGDEEEPAEELSSLYRRALSLVRAEFETRTWDAFWRAVVDGHPLESIAADHGVTIAAIRKSRSRVLHRLKEEIGDLLD
jgi:RNA polymerase sigma-70 factor (ECF subfamily)